MKSYERVLYTAVGSLIPILIVLYQLDPDQVFFEFSIQKFLGWAVRFVVLVAIGVVVGLIYHSENDRIKLMQLGIAAPALISTFAGTAAFNREKALRIEDKKQISQSEISNKKSEIPSFDFISLFIREANARQTNSNLPQKQPQLKTGWSEFLQGLTGVSQEQNNINKIKPNFWVNGNNGVIPSGAFQAGFEQLNDNDYPLYICLANYKGSTQPGKIRVGLKGCNIAFGRKEVQVTDYSVLMPSNFVWKKIMDGHIPENALIAGSDVEPSFKNLYICRASIPNASGVHSGKMRDDFDGCNISWGGRAYSVKQYEILINGA